MPIDINLIPHILDLAPIARVGHQQPLEHYAQVVKNSDPFIATSQHLQKAVSNRVKWAGILWKDIMRVALISDIHGNYTALQAVLADLPSQGADQVMFLGDAATIGPQPVETLDALRDLACSALILGNHDEAVLDPSRAGELQVAPNLQASILWCMERLRADQFDFLRKFQATFSLKLSDEISLLCYHGSPLSNIDQILSTTTEEKIDKYFSGQTASVWAGGHTHIQMLRRHGDKMIINGGSVGNAFHHSFKPGAVPRLLPWAEYSLLSVEKEIVTAHLRRVPYDTQKTLAKVRQSEMPSMDWWLEQYK